MGLKKIDYGPMKMGTMHVDRSLQRQWQDIHKYLLLWFEEGDVERERLKELMREYLWVAPHSKKFFCQVIPAIIHINAANNENFSGKKAANAFGAIAKYASNLICQPWRQEFYQIKLYCGYYKQEVGESLLNAESIFEAMGYHHNVDSHCLNLDIPDPDLVLRVCQDAIMAQLECTIMQQMYDKLGPSRTSWFEISEHRKKYVGEPGEAARYLIALHRERKYEERMRQQASYNQQPQHNHMAYTTPCYTCSRYAQIYSPPQVITHQPCILKPQDLYPSNGYQYHNHHPAMNSFQNGFPYNQQVPAPYTIPTTVPTGKLIEIDSSPVHQSHTTFSYPVPRTELPSSKAKNDGAGEWEYWDSVYKKSYPQEPSVEQQLSRQMRGITLARSTTPPNRIETSSYRGDTDRPRPNKNSIELEDVVHDAGLIKENSKPRDKVNNRGQSTLLNSIADSVIQQSVNKNIPTKYEDEMSCLSVDLIDSVPRTPSPGAGDNIRRSEIPKHATNVALPKENIQQSRPNIITLDVSASFIRDVSPVVELPPRKKWQCPHCTYDNEEGKMICDMCCKSRAREDMAPCPRGGQQCSYCTLINEKEEKNCTACDKPLKGSPTYV